MTETTTTSDAGPLTTLAMKLMHAEREASTEFRDVLPLHAGKRAALKWIPSTSDYSHQAGFAVVDDDKLTTAYCVSETPCSIGRSFFFSKVGGKTAGTDKTRAGYVVEAGPTGATDRCECRSWQVRGVCRHLDTIRTLIANGWV